MSAFISAKLSFTLFFSQQTFCIGYKKRFSGLNVFEKNDIKFEISVPIKSVIREVVKITANEQKARKVQDKHAHMYSN